MKITSLSFAAIIGLLAFVGQSFTVNPWYSSKTVKVDTMSSSVQWRGYKVTGKHNGVVNIKSGELTFDANGMLSGGAFVIDMNTITVLDQTGEWKTKLEGHLKSDDFFGVSNYPTAKLVITKVVSRGKPGEYKIIGNITIKETTKEIRFDADLTEEGNKVVAVADFKIDRSEFNVRYGSGSFFDGLGDKTIYDDFELSIKLTASK